MRLKKIILFSSFLALLGFLFNFNVPTVKAATVEELLAKIQQLQTQILLLQGQLAEFQGQPSEWCHDFNTNIKWKDTGSEVEALQTILEKEGFQVSADEKTNKYFYTSTLEAMMDLQCKYKTDISKSAGYEIDCTGFVGSGTRVQLNELYGCKVKPCITVLSPNGGESWVIGNTYTISWNHNFSQHKEYVGKITLLKGGNFYGNIASITSGATGYPWQVGNIKGGVGTGNDYKVKIEFTNQSGKIVATDVSDNYFSIVAATTTCTDSDGGNDYYVKGTTSGMAVDGTTVIQTDSCTVCGTETTAQSCVVEWFCSNNYVTNTNYPCSYGCQDGACIATTTPSLTVVSPNGGETWVSGNTYTITWNASSDVGQKLIDISLMDSRKDYYTYIAKDTTSIYLGSGKYSYSWTVPQSITPGENMFKVRVESMYLGVYDESDNYFSIISATTTCTDSDGGLNYYVKGVVKMTQGPILELYDACAGSNLLQERVCNSNTDYLQNTVNFTCSYGCQDGACMSTTTPSITVVSPNGGERWVIGNTYDITWKASGVNEVQIAFMKGEVAFELIPSIPVSVGKYSWTIGATHSYIITAGDQYRIRILTLPPPSGVWREGIDYDKSDNYFSIVAATTCNSLVNMYSCLDNVSCYWDQQTDKCYNYDLTKQTCSDPDGGKNYNTQAHTFGFRTYSSAIDPSRDLRIRTGGLDVCISSSTLREHYCTDTYYINTIDVTCPSGTTCQNGAYVNAAIIPPAPILSPAGGEAWQQGKSQIIKWTPYGNVNSVMISLYKGGVFQKTLVTTGDSSGQWTWNIPVDQPTGSLYSIRVSRLSYPSDFIADSNYFSIVAATTTCTDSDGGLNYNVKGTVTSGGAVNTDVCSASGYLFEQYCLNGNPVQTTYWCPNGCQDGACLATSTNILNIAKAATSPSGTVARGTFQTYAIWDLYNAGSNNISITSLTLKSKTGLPPTIPATATSILFRLTDEYGTIITLGTPVVSYSAGTITFDSTVLIGGVFTIPANSLKTLKLQINTTNVSIWPAYTPMQWEVNSVSATGGTVRGLPATTNLVTIMNGLGLIDIENQLANISKAISALLEQINKLLGM